MTRGTCHAQVRDLPTLLLLLVLDRVPTFAVNCIDHAVTEVLFLTVYMCLSRNSSQFVLDYKPREVGTTTMMAPCLISAKSKLCGHTAACPFLPRIFSFLVSPYFCLVPLLFLLLGSLLHLKIAIPPPMAPKDHIFRKLSGNESTAPFLVGAQEALQMTRVVLQATRPGTLTFWNSKSSRKALPCAPSGIWPMLLVFPRFSPTWSWSRCPWASVEAPGASRELAVSGQTSRSGYS